MKFQIFFESKNLYAGKRAWLESSSHREVEANSPEEAAQKYYKDYHGAMDDKNIKVVPIVEPKYFKYIPPVSIGSVAETRKPSWEI